MGELKPRVSADRNGLDNTIEWIECDMPKSKATSDSGKELNFQKTPCGVEYNPYNKVYCPKSKYNSCKK